MTTILDIFDEIVAAIDTNDRAKLDEQFVLLVRLQEAMGRNALQNTETDHEEACPLWFRRCGCGAWGRRW